MNYGKLNYDIQKTYINTFSNRINIYEYMVKYINPVTPNSILIRCKLGFFCEKKRVGNR